MPDVTSRPHACSSQGICCVRKLSCPSSTIRNTCGSSHSYGLDGAIEIERSDDRNVSVNGFERIVLTIEGMTCTGCEKSLRKYLESIPAVSKINIILLPPKVEFDLEVSTAYNGTNIASLIGKKTGFKCTVVPHGDEELDLVLALNVSDLGDDVPRGVSDLQYYGKKKERLRVHYQPNVIGARDLLAQPFFRNASLAPVLPSPLAASGKAEFRDSLWRTTIAFVLTLPVLVFAYAELAIFQKHKIATGAASLVLATLVQLVALPIYSRAYKVLVFSHMIEMDMLIVLSTTTAFVYSVVAYVFLVTGKPLSMESFFETSTLLVTLTMAGRTCSDFARHRAVESISGDSLQTRTVVRVTDDKQNEEIDIRLLQYGDFFKVPPYTTIATDGIVIHGETAIDESMITGESVLVGKGPRSNVIAGTLNRSGIIVVQLTRLPSENTIKQITKMIDEAVSTKPKVQRMADWVAGYFTWAILAITVLIFCAWVVVGMLIRHQHKAEACIQAMTYAIATLIISCPCAIGLAVPMVVVVAGGVGARHGLLLKSGETLEVARKITHVVFDKTGTLTQPTVIHVQYQPVPMAVEEMTLALLANNKHPVSRAIENHLKNVGTKSKSIIENVASIPGFGVEGMYDGIKIQAGSPHWFGFEQHPLVLENTHRNWTVCCIVIDGKLAAVYGLQDEIRPGTHETVNKLKQYNIAVSVISGDSEEAVVRVAESLFIPPENCRFRYSPSEKQAYVKELLAQPGPKQTVLFLGDGTNDAIALAQASIGMHLSEGTDVALSAADVVLMKHTLEGVLTLIDLSRAFYRRVVFNFVWSAVYNIFAIFLAAGALGWLGKDGKVRIPPKFAGLGEVVSVLPVILVAVSLRWKTF